MFIRKIEILTSTSKNMVIEKGFTSKIDNRYLLKVATESHDDFQKICKFNVKVHGEEIRGYIDRVFKQHPRKKEILWFYLEDTDLHQIISSLNLMPLEWVFEGELINLCEMGFVGTLEQYRGNGFIGILNSYYEKAMAERNYILSVLRGIPYYYRRFNYEFVFPLDERLLLSYNQIPSKKLDHIIIRKATKEDLPHIESLYNSNYSRFCIYNNFEKTSFTFKFLNDSYNDNQLMTYILEEDNEIVGYFSLGMSYDNTAFTIIPSSLNEELIIKILQFIRIHSEKAGNNVLNLNVSENLDFSNYIISLGAKITPSYGWQVKIPDFKKFFRAIKKILERRINNSNFPNLSRSVVFSNYQETIELQIVNGRIKDITSEMGFPESEKCDVRIPGSFILKLLLSDRTISELNYIIKDARVKQTSLALLDALFPKKKSIPDTYF